jgi:hypothetical protein
MASSATTTAQSASFTRLSIGEDKEDEDVVAWTAVATAGIGIGIMTCAT